jgi:predicted glycosyltransferase
MRELKKFPGRAVVVRGLSDGNHLESSGSVTVIDYASTIELNKLICSAGIVVCRAGYTSVMDILKLGKKVILIPTPGQAEQEYLGKHLAKNKLAMIVHQENLNLESALVTANEVTTKVFINSADQYKIAVRALVDSIIEKEGAQSVSGDLGKSKK